MCTRTRCRTCGKPSYSGCGQHIEQVLGDVPKSQRCRCAEEKAAAKRAAREAAGSSQSWWARLLSK